MLSRFRFKMSLVACAVLCVTNIRAASVTMSAVNNATIQPGGPRTGSNGKTFFNVEGTSNGTFADYAVADFRVPTGQTPFIASSFGLALTQANAAFTTNGALNFYLTTDTSTSIDPGTSTYAFPTPSPALSFNLGPGIFTQVANGHVDQYIFSLTGAVQTYVDTQISAAGILRIVIEPSDPNVAATWAGYTFTPASEDPQLTLSSVGAQVPEPSSVILFGIAGINLIGLQLLRRMRR